MAESELLKKLKEEGIGIKGVFRILEEEKAEIQITQLVNYNNNMFKIAIAKRGYALLTKDGVTIPGDGNRIYLHPYGSQIVYMITESKKSKGNK